MTYTPVIIKGKKAEYFESAQLFKTTAHLAGARQ